MKTFDFNFILDLWIKSLEIDADSYEEAFEKLTSMSVNELISQGYIKDFEINSIDVDITSYDEDDDYEGGE